MRRAYEHANDGNKDAGRRGELRARATQSDAEMRQEIFRIHNGSQGSANQHAHIGIRMMS